MATELRAGAALADEALEALRRRVGRTLRGERDGRGLRVGLACALFNGAITGRLLEGALAGLADCKVSADDLLLCWAPGAFELPLVAAHLVAAEAVDAVVALGAVVRGETGHYDFVAGECASGLARVGLDTGVPVVFGVLTTDTVDQALARSPLPGEGGGSPEDNKGYEAALTAVEMATLVRTAPLRGGRGRQGAPSAFPKNPTLASARRA
jgi:6,7-dimethyl-8-ribityllumazine synthase